jgi:acyl carrier protein
MGLDSVELVLRVEDAFDIAITNAEAEKIRTPRDLIELVMAKVGRSDMAVCLTQRAFHRLRRAFMTELHLKRSELQLDTATEELLPLPNRRRMLGSVCQSVGVPDLPNLVRPRWLEYSMIAASLAAFIVVSLALPHFHSGKSLWLNFLTQCNWLMGLVAAIVLLKIGYLTTRSMKTAFPAHLTTARGLTRWLVANHPGLIGAPPGQWSREQVAEKMREIVIEQLGVENYREEARFVEDLGMD